MNHIIKKRLKTVLSFNGISIKELSSNVIPKDSTFSLERELGSETRELPGNVEGKIIRFLQEKGIHNTNYLYGISDDFGEIKEVKKMASPIKPQYRSMDGCLTRHDIDISMRENNCVYDVVKKRVNELHINMRFINHWFSDTNDKAIYSIINKRIKSIHKDDQKILAYFLEGSVSSLAIGFSGCIPESFTPNRLCKYYLNPDEAALLNEAETEKMIGGLGITRNIWRDMVNQIVTIPEAAAMEMLDLYNIITKQNMKLDNLFIEKKEEAKNEAKEYTGNKRGRKPVLYPEGFINDYMMYICQSITLEELMAKYKVSSKTLMKYIKNAANMQHSPYAGGFKYASSVVNIDKSSLLQSPILSIEIPVKEPVSHEKSKKNKILEIIEEANDFTIDELNELSMYLSHLASEKRHKLAIIELISNQ